MKCAILQKGDARLAERSLPVEERPELTSLWRDLEDTLQNTMTCHHFRNSAGISAVQIGILRRVCLVWTPSMGFLHIANPTVSEAHGTDVEYEGCLSFFDVRGLVARPAAIKLSFQDHDFAHQDRTFRGWEARIILHELDHMNGVLYTERMQPGAKLISHDEYLRLGASAHRS